MTGRRSLANFLAGVAYSGSAVILGLLAMPVVLEGLGTERFGAFRALVDWYSHFGLLQFGLGAGMLPLLVRAVAVDDTATMRTTFGAASRAYVRVAMLSIAAGVGFIVVAPHVVPVTEALGVDLRLAAFVTTLGFLLLPLAPFRALAEATGRSYAVSLLLLMQNVLITGASVVLAVAGWGMTGQALAIVPAGVVFHLMLVRDGLKRCPGLLEAVTRPDTTRTNAVRLWDMSRASWVIDVCGRISIAIDNILISALLGPIWVVPFFITQKLPLLAQMQLQSIGNASWAMLAYLHARGERRAFERRLLDVTRIVSVAGVAVLGPVVAFNRGFVDAWVGADRYAGDLITLVAASNAFLLGLFSFWTWCIVGVGALTDLVPLAIGQAAVNLVVSVGLTATLGMAGPVLGTLVGYAAMSAWYLPRVIRRRFGIQVRDLAVAAAAPLTVGVPYTCALAVLMRRYEPTGLMASLFGMVTAVLVFLGLWGLCFLSREQRRRGVSLALEVVRGHVTESPPMAAER